MIRACFAIVFSFILVTEVRGGIIPPEVVGTVGTYDGTSSFVHPNGLQISTVHHSDLGNEIAYGIMEFRLSDLPDPIAGAWLQLSWNVVSQDIFVNLSVSKGDGQLSLSDFVLGQPVVSYMPYFSSGSNTSNIDISRQLQQARADNDEFIKFTLSTQMDDRFVSYQTDQYPGLPLGIVTELPSNGQIIVPPASVPEPSGLALMLVGFASVFCWGRRIQ